MVLTEVASGVRTEAAKGVQTEGAEAEKVMVAKQKLAAQSTELSKAARRHIQGQHSCIVLWWNELEATECTSQQDGKEWFACLS